MTLLSINLNKFALIRNSRNENKPDLIDICKKCIKYGAGGITVHPRPDERHTKYSDLKKLSSTIKKHKKNIEFNIEGYPSKKFCNLVYQIKPDQVTLVPDPPGAITSSFGWDCNKNKNFLKKIVKKFQSKKIRVSIFINPNIRTLENLNEIGSDRVELYTYKYAKEYSKKKYKIIKDYKKTYDYINLNTNIKINAGHDLNLDNLKFFLKKLPSIKEVSIGHAIVCDSLEYGLEKTIYKYLKIIRN
ncbi:MAG: Pyridoxine 5'-phosphate synthase [Alphaproteobacteria bacterium MarineAlpha5_Bin9]|nr:MAG: Pyridoxine 5'-phosphate synthase [Alphaproteobacteria bacterium MarineAlpha5_Bin9]|tara:strand:- start:31817 stop:32551 length:735 start_codon:yes stop_codon:yes gene_type:complete